MRKSLICALLVSASALPAGAQFQSIHGILVEPRHPTTSDRIRLTVAGITGCPEEIHEPVYDDATGVVVLSSTPPQDCVSAPPSIAFRETFEVGPLPAGRHFAELRADGPGLVLWRELFEVVENTAPLSLGEDARFAVRVHWSNPRDGSSGTGHARKLARDSGAFWFFTPDNLEVTVKVVDGRALNGHWWVFIASMTDLRLEIETRQLGGVPAGTYVKTYVQDAGRNRNFIDVNAFPAFPDGPPPPADPAATAPEIVIDPERPVSTHPVRAELSVFNAGPDVEVIGIKGKSILFDYPEADGPPPPPRLSTAEANVGPLAPGVYSVDVRSFGQHNFGRTFEVAAPYGNLRLQDTADGYFNVYVNLDSPLSGVGHGVNLTRESGYFWFFDPDNIELTVKILDGRAVNGKYWVFIASMTDVAYTVEVEHCVSHSDPFGCGSVYYRSVQGVNQNFIDVDLRGNL